jgi:hypothetical protein
MVEQIEVRRSTHVRVLVDGELQSLAAPAV